MRLIDADTFKKFILNLPKCENGHSKSYDEASIIGFIDIQPTMKKYSILEKRNKKGGNK